MGYCRRLFLVLEAAEVDTAIGTLIFSFYMHFLLSGLLPSGDLELGESLDLNATLGFTMV